MAALLYAAASVLIATAIAARATPPASWQSFDQQAYRAMAERPFSSDPDVRRPPWCWRVFPSLVVYATHLGSERGFRVLTGVSLAVLPAVMMLLVRSMRMSVSTTVLIGGFATLLPPVDL